MRRTCDQRLEMTLENACALIVDCPHTTAQDEGVGYPLVRTPNIGYGRLVFDKMHRVSRAVYDIRNKRAKPLPGDLIYAREAPAGNVALIMPGQEVCLGQRTVLIRPNPEIVDSAFLTYYLLAPAQRNKLLGTATGATVAHVNVPAIRNLEISLPPLPAQKRIADILSAYDDLIENNRRRMEILEESARLIYRKMFGTNKKRTNLLHLEDFVERTISGDWGKESPDRKCTEKIMCLRGADIPSLRYRDFGKGIVRFVTPQHVEERAMKDGDLFVEMSGGSPTQATGRVGLVSSHLLRDAELPVLCTNFCRVIRPKPRHAFFLYLAWLDLYDQDLMFMFEHSAIALKNFDLDLFLKKILVVKPEDSQLRDFNEKIAGVMDQMDVLGGENRRLIKARDILLPKLMNGELAVGKVA